MVWRLVTALAMLGVATGAAQAASFDCAKATTPFEVAICTNPDLSKADEVLAVAYQTAIGGLSKPALAEMQKAQRSWLDYAQRSCTDDARLPKAKYPEEQLSCLQTQISNRARGLEASRMWGGLRFYTVDTFEVIPDSTAEADAWSKVATREISTPRIDGTDAEAEAFNAFIDDMAPKATGEQDETSDVTIKSTIDGVTPARISVVVNNWWYGHGAAHGNYDITYLHFLRGDNRPLQASDILDKDGWQEQLGKLALAELDETIEGGIWEESREDAAANAADPSRWNFSFEGLMIQYQPYEVTAYAYGAPVVTIPWAQLTDFLSDRALEIGQY
ncbi:MAG TPA: DUF3298 domain-containing protein [Devosia sp.]